MNDDDLRIARARLGHLVNGVLTTDLQGLVRRLEAWRATQPGFNSPDDERRGLQGVAIEEAWARAAIAFKESCVRASAWSLQERPRATAVGEAGAQPARSPETGRFLRGSRVPVAVPPPSPRAWIDSSLHSELADRVAAHKQAKARADRLSRYATRALTAALAVLCIGSVLMALGLDTAGLVLVATAAIGATTSAVLAVSSWTPTWWGGVSGRRERTRS